MQDNQVAAHRITDRDDVAVALRCLREGERITVQGEQSAVTVGVVQEVPRGHKVALRDIGKGEAIFKYGSPIGAASVEIPAGSHVHIHNLEGGRGRGDR
ncbi:MAG: UxaA family hydrolase [Synergistaceae bacterium]|jgi:altronate dehydratase small subunit|nr:UxaA family hydrolase [Synergistaceae bacterium]